MRTKPFNKRVSVLLPFYSADKLKDLCLSIKSIAGQTYGGLEVVLVQDGPVPGEMQRAVSDIVASDERIVLIKNDRNLGLKDSLNKAMSKATGEYIARQDADDVSAPDRIEKQIRKMEQDNLDILGTWFYELNTKTGKNEFRKMPVSPQEIKNTLPVTSPFCHGSVMFRKDAVKGLGGYQAPFPNDDYELWWRAYVKGLKMANLPEPLYTLRIDPDSYFKRRRGLKMSFAETGLRFKIVKEGKYPLRYYFAALLAFFLRLLPSRILEIVYSLKNRMFGSVRNV